MIAQEIRSLIIKNFLFGVPRNGMEDTDSLMEKGIIDSLGVLDLINQIEETYGIKVEDEELIPENLDSIAALSKFVLKKLDQGQT